MQRTAILLDENGEEIFRGHPADMPVRFVKSDGTTIGWTMSHAMEAGTPIDEATDDVMSMHEDG